MPITPGEAYQIWFWARQRQNAKHPQARSRRFSSSKSDLSIHVEGVKAEYAIAKLFCLPFDPKPLAGGDKHAPDLTLPNGTTIQVKFRGKRDWAMALSGIDPDEFSADIGILCFPATDDKADDDVDVAGWITRDEFLDVAEIVNYLGKEGGERLACQPEDLHPIEELLAEVYARVA